MTKQTQFLLQLFSKCGSVSTDTRKIKSGELFFSLKGENFDANLFATKALENGAAYVVVDNVKFAIDGDERYIVVEDSLKALQNLATAWRRQLDIPVIGLTGSNGKTTTKELLVAILQTHFKTAATTGNFNNQIGVPLTLLSISRDAEVAVIEMGSNQPGDIAELVNIAQPSHGLITNIGLSHLELLHDLDGVQKEKENLFQYINNTKGRIFVNAADDRVLTLAQSAPHSIVYGKSGTDAQIEILSQNMQGMSLKVQHKDWSEAQLFSAQLSGAHNAINILAAITIAQSLAVPIPKMQKGIASYKSTNNRSQLISWQGRKVWMDAYNANPSSMRAAISHIMEAGKGKVALVLGDMLEMGEGAEQIHRDLGKFIASFSPYLVVGLGSNMKAALEEISDTQTFWIESSDRPGTQWPNILGEAELILFKGSRGMALEKLLM